VTCYWCWWWLVLAPPKDPGECHVTLVHLVLFPLVSGRRTKNKSTPTTAEVVKGNRKLCGYNDKVAGVDVTCEDGASREVTHFVAYGGKEL